MKAGQRINTKAIVIFALAVCALRLSIAPYSQSQAQNQITTVAGSWRPRKEVKGGRLVGSKTCAACHKKVSVLQHDTVMAKALALPENCEILISHKELTFTSGPYRYLIVRQGNRSLYTVTDGTKTISEPILYCFGQGKAGQTYLFKHNGSFYESRMSFFKEIDGLDYTIGYPHIAAPNLDEASGRAISSDEAQNCFSCHATGAVNDNRLQLDHLVPGVSCEACHGPGAEHVLAMKAQEYRDARIFDPGKLDTDELGQEYCGACHRSVDEVSRMPNLGGGVHNVRFQPYRLFNSPGHDPTDSRLRCTACHDPHEDLRRDTAFYDSKCLACHRATVSNQHSPLNQANPGNQFAKACPKSSGLCVTCHMPRTEIPGSHFKFTDHRIRIVRPGDPYPK